MVSLHCLGEKKALNVGGAEYAYAYITLDRHQPTAVDWSLWVLCVGERRSTQDC